MGNSLLDEQLEGTALNEEGNISLHFFAKKSFDLCYIRLNLYFIPKINTFSLVFAMAFPLLSICITTRRSQS